MILLVALDRARHPCGSVQGGRVEDKKEQLLLRQRPTERQARVLLGLDLTEEVQRRRKSTSCNPCSLAGDRS